MADAAEQTKTFKQDPRNARRHSDRNVELIASSILDNGFGRSILLANDGTIIAGNATALAAGQAGLDNAMVIESDGSKIIAVKRTDVDPGSDEFYRLSISDNRAAELATWDPDVLASLQDEGVDLGAFWFDYELAAVTGGEIEGDDPNEHWIGMPEFEQEDQTPIFQIHVNFARPEDIDEFERLVGQTIPRNTKSIWYPAVPVQNNRKKAYVGTGGNDAA